MLAGSRQAGKVASMRAGHEPLKTSRPLRDELTCQLKFDVWNRRECAFRERAQFLFAARDDPECNVLIDTVVGKKGKQLFRIT